MNYDSCVLVCDVDIFQEFFDENKKNLSDLDSESHT